MSPQLERPRSVVRSLRFRATVGVASLLAMIAVLLTTVFVVYVEREEESFRRHTAEDLAASFAPALAAAIAEGDAAALRLATDPLHADARIPHFAIEVDGVIRLQHGTPPGRESEVASVRHRITDAQGRELGALVLGYELADRHSGVSEIRWRAAVITLAMIVFGMAGTMFLVGRIVSPIQDLALATRRLAQGDFDFRLPDTGDDEIGALARNFAEMTGRLRAATERRLEWQRELETRVAEKTREIEETRKHLSNIVENVGASILVADLDGTIVSANTHAMHIFGTKPEFLVGRNLAEFPRDGRDAASILSEIREARGPIVSEGTWRLDERRELDLLVTHTLLRDAEGEPAGVLQITKDITPLKGMERRLVSSERMSAMGEMAGEIGHELNNYLMAIGGRAELILAALDRKVDAHVLAKVRAGAGIIAGQVSEMRRLTDGLLESARTETSPREFDLAELVRSTIEFVRPQNRFDAVRIELTAPDGGLTLHADPQQIRQVVLNLLSNAAEAIRERGDTGGTIRVEIFRQEETAGVRVSDDGRGFDDETRRRIFEPHFTTKEKGHGFGLAVCHRVVENHGGRIEAASRPGEGATFTIQLPLNPSPSASSAAASP
jgi:two-component system nitrogen regulation sensor histidine kinase NtrY